MTRVGATAKCETCGHKKMKHQLQPRVVICYECQDETRGTRNTKASHPFRGESDPQ